MNTTLSDFSAIKAMGHGQRVPEVVAKVIHVARPYNLTDRDKEYGWHRQIVNLEGINGETMAMTIYSDKMHLGSENEGQVWRFRCLPSDGGPRGVEVAKWKPAGKSETNVELKLHKTADASRLPFMEGEQAPAPKNSEPAPQKPKDAPKEPEVPANESGEVEELVIAEIRARRDVGRAKYGTTMERQDIDIIGWLQHRLEELCDDAIYTRRVIRDLREGRLVLVSADRLAELEGKALEVPAFLEKKKPETHASIREINEEAERQLEERRREKTQREPLDGSPPWEELQRDDGDKLRQQIEDAEVAERNAEKGLSEAPVEKPGRNSKAPHGSDPLREKPKGQQETKEQPKQQDLPKDANADRNDEIERMLAIKFVAAKTRFAYMEEADEEQVSHGHKAIKFVKDGRVTWTEAFNHLVSQARANPDEEDIVEGAFAVIKKQVSKEKPVDDDFVCECIVKNPKGFREIFDKVKSGAVKP
jgi:hypothetical protein